MGRGRGRKRKRKEHRKGNKDTGAEVEKKNRALENIPELPEQEQGTWPPAPDVLAGNSWFSRRSAPHSLLQDLTPAVGKQLWWAYLHQGNGQISHTHTHTSLLPLPQHLPSNLLKTCQHIPVSTRTRDFPLFRNNSCECRPEWSLQMADSPELPRENPLSGCGLLAPWAEAELCWHLQ